MNQSENKAIAFLKKHGFNILFWGALLVVVFQPNARAWVLQQFIKTGIFNAKIEEEKYTEKYASTDNDFRFENTKGEIIHTADLRDQVIFVNFWASWCPPCIAEFPSVEKLYKHFENHPQVTFVMINEDQDIEKGLSFLKKQAYTVPFHRLRSQVSQELYQGALPTTFVLNKKGEVVLHHTGLSNYGSKKFIAQIEKLAAE